MSKLALKKIPSDQGAKPVNIPTKLEADWAKNQSKLVKNKHQIKAAMRPALKTFMRSTRKNLNITLPAVPSRHLA